MTIRPAETSHSAPHLHAPAERTSVPPPAFHHSCPPLTLLSIHDKDRHSGGWRCKRARHILWTWFPCQDPVQHQAL